LLRVPSRPHTTVRHPPADREWLPPPPLPMSRPCWTAHLPSTPSTASPTYAKAGRQDLPCATRSPAQDAWAHHQGRRVGASVCCSVITRTPDCLSFSGDASHELRPRFHVGVVDGLAAQPARERTVLVGNGVVVPQLQRFQMANVPPGVRIVSGSSMRLIPSADRPSCARCPNSCGGYRHRRLFLGDLTLHQQAVREDPSPLDEVGVPVGGGHGGSGIGIHSAGRPCGVDEVSTLCSRIVDGPRQTGRSPGRSTFHRRTPHHSWSDQA
jgi:hypothetical protein